MRTLMLFFAISLVASHGLQAQTTSLPFYDDFSRPDNSSVGSGWTNVSIPGQQGGALVLQNGKAVLTEADKFGGIYRPVDFSGPLTVQATFSQTSGYGGTLNRFGNSIVRYNDGTFLNGYALNFYRGDQNYNNSTVSLAVGTTTQVGSVASTFQFSSLINVNATFFQDGSVQGVVSDDNNNTFNFSFGPYAYTPASNANNVLFAVSGPDSRLGTLTFPTIDNISVIPEPSTYAVVLGAATLSFVAIRRRRAAA